VQALACCAGRVLHLLQAARADAARREVDHPQEAGVVTRVLQQPQVGQRVLDLGPLEKAQAAIDPVGHAGVEQRGLDHTALRIAAVQHRNLLALMPSRTSWRISSTIHCASARSLVDS
jgi:hypothetical protein